MLARALLLVVTSLVTVGPRACTRQESADPPDAPAPSASASAAPVDTSVTFARPPLVVGARHTDVSDTSSKLLLDIDPGKGRRTLKRELTTTESVRLTTEVLAVSGWAVTKTRITFDKLEDRITDATTSTTKPNRIAGKTYIVEAKGAKVDVRDEKGRPAPKDESAAVTKWLGPSFGKPDPLPSTLPATLKPGDAVEAVAKALELYLDDDQTTLSNVRVTFKEKQGDEGVFTVAMKMTKEDDRMLLLVDLSGELRISTRTAELTKLGVSGPITVLTSPKAKAGTTFAGSGLHAVQLTSTLL